MKVSITLDFINLFFKTNQVFETSQLNLIDLFFKTNHVLKNKSIKLCKVYFNAKNKLYIPKFVNKFSFKKVRLHSFRVQIHMVPLQRILIWTYKEMVCQIIRYCFLWWEIKFHCFQVTILSCWLVIPTHAFSFRFLVIFPFTITYFEPIPSNHCWHQLLL